MPDLVVVGAASRDVADDDPRGWRLGGAVTYCSLTAARLGLRVGTLAGVDGPAGRAAELGLLEAAGVDLRRVRLEHGPVFENLERDGHRRQRWLSPSHEIPVDALPDSWGSARAWLFVPVAGEVPEVWASVPPPDAVVGLGWQGMLREMTPDGWVGLVAPKASRLAATAGLACASTDDLVPRTELAELRRRAPKAVIVLTRGSRGGIVLHGDRRERYAAIPAARVADPTGAGDVFLAALMVAWLLTGGAATAAGLRFAAAAASCSVEGVGLHGVPTRSELAARLAARRAAGG